MAVEGYAAYADIGNEDTDTLTLVGTQVAVNATAGLFWYLAKAGIPVATPPTTGQGWPR